MNVIFAGRSENTDVRIETARKLGFDVSEVVDGGDLHGASGASETAAVFVALPSDRVMAVAAPALRALHHVFIDGAVPSSVHDARVLIDIAAEAKVQVSCSRPQWFNAEVQELIASGPARMISVTTGIDPGTTGWRRSLYAAVDLSGALCGTFATRRIDVEVARTVEGRPIFAVIAMRFLNGSFVVMQLGPGQVADTGTRIITANDSGVDELLLRPSEALLARETEAFLNAVGHGTAAPVPLRNAYDASAVVEQIMERLRQ